LNFESRPFPLFNFFFFTERFDPFFFRLLIIFGLHVSPMLLFRACAQRQLKILFLTFIFRGRFLASFPTRFSWPRCRQFNSVGLVLLRFFANVISIGRRPSPGLLRYFTTSIFQPLYIFPPAGCCSRRGPLWIGPAGFFLFWRIAIPALRPAITACLRRWWSPATISQVFSPLWGLGVLSGVYLL